MSTVEEITAAIERLPADEVAQVRDWLAERPVITPPAVPPPAERRVTLAELRKMPPEQREPILAKWAAAVEWDYWNDPELTAFEAFGPEDLYDETPDAGPR